MKISTIDSRSLAEYLQHNLMMSGFYIEIDGLLLIADMMVDYLTFVAREETMKH